MLVFSFLPKKSPCGHHGPVFGLYQMTTNKLFVTSGVGFDKYLFL